MSISIEHTTSTPGLTAKKEINIANIAAVIFIFQNKDKDFSFRFLLFYSCRELKGM